MLAMGSYIDIGGLCDSLFKFSK